jgi:hypothetical protein
MTRSFGKGRVISERKAREVLLADGVMPDCEFERYSKPGRVLEVPLPVHHAVSNAVPPGLDYIHRSVPGAEIYFVANPSNGWQCARCTFRVSGKAPEIWDPVRGRRMFAPAYQESQGRTTMPLEFAPCGSWFVIFRAAEVDRRLGGGLRSALGRAGKSSLRRPRKLAYECGARDQVLLGHGDVSQTVRPA